MYTVGIIVNGLLFIKSGASMPVAWCPALVALVVSQVRCEWMGVPSIPAITDTNDAGCKWFRHGLCHEGVLQSMNIFIRLFEPSLSIPSSHNPLTACRQHLATVCDLGGDGICVGPQLARL